jgi:hypothetical protein
MKKVVAVLVAMFMMVCVTSVGFAEDIILSAKVERVLFKTDKQGAPYAMVLFAQKATLNGVEYNKTMSAMAFGDTVQGAKSLKRGDTMKVIALLKDYKGAPSYQILKFID